MKKIYEFVAVGMILCIFSIVPAVSAQATTVTIADASADHGLTTTTEIRAYNVEHLRGFTITLGYDPTIVMVVDEEINSIFGMDASVIASNATGSVILGSLSMDADVTSDDVLLATVTLRADGDPTEQSTLNITVDALINTTNQQIQPRSETDGTFTVSGLPAWTYITIADASADHGLTTTTEIRAYNVEHLRGFTITLGYDPTIVMVVDEEINSIFGMDASVIASNATGSVILGSLSMDADVTSDDVLLATVTLRADGDPTEQSTLNITVDALINTTNQQIQPRSETDGTFTVGIDPPPSLVTYTITNTTISPNGDGVMDDTGIDVEFSEPVDAAILIENATGVVKSLYISPDDVTDPDPQTWDGTDDGGSIVADGTYQVNVTMDDGVNHIVYDNTRSIMVANMSVATISIGNGSGIVTIPIAIEGGVNVGACDITLTYNASVVNVTGVTGGDMDVTMANLEQAHVGLVRIGTFQTSNPGLNGNIIFANVMFEPIGATGDTCSLNLSVTTFKDATNVGNVMPYIVRNGTYCTLLNGDVNGDGVVDIHDAMYLAKHVLDKSGFEVIIVEAADVNDDKKIDIADSMYIAKHVLGITGFEELR